MHFRIYSYIVMSLDSIMNFIEVFLFFCDLLSKQIQLMQDNELGVNTLILCLQNSSGSKYMNLSR